MYGNEYEVLCMMNSSLNFNLESVLKKALFLICVFEKFQFAGSRESHVSPNAEPQIQRGA